MVLQFVDNVIGGVLSGYVMTLMTKQTDQEYLGRINGFVSTLMFFGIMVSSILSGLIVKHYSIVVAFSVASLLFLICFIMLYIESKKGLMDDVEIN